MERHNSPERLVFFSDAVVAIALTLLVLPLTDSVPDLVAEHRPAIDVLSENGWQITSFLLTFLVIGIQWRAHHRLFSYVKAHNPLLVRLNFVWLLTVAVFPLPSELTGAYGHDRFAVLFYIGTITVNALTLMTMTLLVHHDEKLAHEPRSITPERLEDSIGTVAGLVLAFVVSALFPPAGYYSLFLLVIPGRLAWLRHRVRNRAREPQLGE